MRLFSEKVNHTFTNSPFNIIQVEVFEEIFFGIYEVEINKSKYPVEKISEYNGSPVVSVPVVMEGREVFYPFVLSKGKPEILFNEENTISKLFPNGNFELIKENSVEEPIIEDRVITPIEETIIESNQSNKEEILEQIELAKNKARQQIENLKKQKIEEASLEIKNKKKLLDETLANARTSLVEEFVLISDRIKDELFDATHERSSAIEDELHEKISNLSQQLSKSIKKDFNSSTEVFDKKIKQLVKEMYSTLVEPKVDKELHSIAEDVVAKVGEIEKTLDSKLKDKVDVSIVEGVNREISAIRSANIELNDSINKGVNRALSRVGNVKTQLDQFSEQFLQDLDYKIQESETKISDYYEEKIKTLEDKTFDLTEESRKYFVSLISESRDNLLSEIKQLKTETPVEYILESKSGKPAKLNIESFNKEYDKKLKDMIATEVVNLRKYISVYASGGGTVAVQYANGGTMNGDLNITGRILSAGVDIATKFGSGGGGGSTTIVNGTTNQISANTVGNTVTLSLPNSIVTPGDLNVTGSLYIGGSSFQVATSSMSVNDPLIYLANGNIGNAVDIGFVGHFNNGLYQHTGLARKASDGIWTLFSGVTSEPTNTNIVSTTDPTYKIDTLRANIIGNFETTSLSGIVLSSPNGNRWGLSVDNQGALITTQL